MIPIIPLLLIGAGVVGLAIGRDETDEPTQDAPEGTPAHPPAETGGGVETPKAEEPTLEPGADEPRPPSDPPAEPVDGRKNNGRHKCQVCGVFVKKGVEVCPRCVAKGLVPEAPAAGA